MQPPKIRSEGSKVFVVCFQHISCQMFFYETPGRRPPHAIDGGVRTVTLGWVRGPNQRDPLRVHDALVGFVDRCRTWKMVCFLYDTGIKYAYDIIQGSRVLVACCQHFSCPVFFHQTPGRRPPYIIDRGVRTVILGWVGPLTSAIRLEFITQSLGLSIDVEL